MRPAPFKMRLTRAIVDGNVAQDALAVNDVGAAEWDWQEPRVSV